MKVTYRSERPTLPPVYGHWTDINKLRETIRESLAVKAPEWEYEREVRYLVKLERCSPSKGMFFMEFVDVALREVVLGSRSHSNLNFLLHFLQNSYRGFDVASARRAPSSKYEMQISQARIGPLADGSEFDHILDNLDSGHSAALGSS